MSASSEVADIDVRDPRFKQPYKQGLFKVNAPRMLAFCIVFVVFQVVTLFFCSASSLSADTGSSSLTQLFSGSPWGILKIVALCAGILFAVFFTLVNIGSFRRPQAQGTLTTTCLLALTAVQLSLCFFEIGGAYSLCYYAAYTLMLGVLPVLAYQEGTLYLAGFSVLCLLVFPWIASLDGAAAAGLPALGAGIVPPPSAADALTADTFIASLLLVLTVLAAGLCASWLSYGQAKKNIVADIRLEHERAGLEALVQERTAAYRERAHEAEVSDLAKTHLLMRLSHELRTSMNTISGRVFLARGSGDSEGWKECLDVIDQASLKLKDAAESIIDTAGVELDLGSDDHSQDSALLCADAAAPQHNDEQVEPPDLTGHTILIVEDLETNRLVLSEFLKDTKATIEEAPNGRIAVEMFAASAEGHYSFVFMDLLMPEMSGYDATREIRRMERADAMKVPIVAVSANAFKEDIEASLAAGMDAHIAKPIEQSTIFRTLKERLP